MKKQVVDIWIVDPMKRFMNNSTTSGIVLFSSALLALLLSNSPWAVTFHHLWETEFFIGFGDFSIVKTLHHWINDGLMAIFFFVVGLELKREIIAGELSSPRNAILPLVAAMGGMIVPALIYLFFNGTGEASNGWGIAMATDIAFALGILYLLGSKVPISLKIFLTALAIADDIGAVLVIAFFYTSEIDFVSLSVGAIFLALLVSANLIGIRSTLFYGIVGIGGLWTAFLMSGVHATIAAVLAAFTIPANTRVSESFFTKKIESLLDKFKDIKSTPRSTVTPGQLHVLQDIRNYSKMALTPLQRLEHGLHPLVAFIIMPIFALSNAGVSINSEFWEQLKSPVTYGVMGGLILGKVIGVLGFVYLMIKLKWAQLPLGMNNLHMVGVSFLAAIGFTMSLFISELAFENEMLVAQAKIGILLASILASFIGFHIIRIAGKKSIPVPETPLEDTPLS
ncbi:MAG: Na+/H+ antiporter NhaA [Sediminicola sp.]